MSCTDEIVITIFFCLTNANGVDHLIARGRFILKTNKMVLIFSEKNKLFLMASEKNKLFAIWPIFTYILNMKVNAKGE